jgi:hypothetical protein
LPHNLKIEGFEELMDESKYPRQMSFFDNKKWPGIKFVGALEMPGWIVAIAYFFGNNYL